jgi:hypothetical protein
MADAEDSFIVEGIRRYAEALDTVETFETMLQERLKEVLKDYSSKGFTPSGNSMDVGTGNRPKYGRFVWIAQEGRLRSRKETVWLEVGLWWRDQLVAYYAGFLDGDDKRIAFSYNKNHPRIEHQKWGRKARLFMVAPPNSAASLDAELKIVLDELIASFV